MASPASKQKLYCYVDETGQHTDGHLFFVAVVIVGDDRDKLRRELTAIEESSGKHIKKWVRSTKKQRYAYIRSVLSIPGFTARLYYSKYEDSRAYVDLTILSTAKAINTHSEDSKEIPKRVAATILVDGLHSRFEEHRFAKGLRQLRVSVRKVRGLTDQSDQFVRLADAVAAFVRSSLEGDELLKPLFNRAITDGKLREV
jgi:hypothetical protein